MDTGTPTDTGDTDTGDTDTDDTDTDDPDTDTDTDTGVVDTAPTFTAADLAGEEGGGTCLDDNMAAILLVPVLFGVASLRRRDERQL